MKRQIAGLVLVASVLLACSAPVDAWKDPRQTNPTGSGSCYSPPPKCVTVSSPPPKCYSPPPKCVSPVAVASPPPKCYSPPPKCVSPVAVASPPPVCYSPPPKCDPVAVASPPPKCDWPTMVYSPPPACSGNPPVNPGPTPSGACDDADWMCKQCTAAAASNAAGSSYTGACIDCSNKVGADNAYGCSQCLASSGNPAVVAACLACVVKGLPPWACNQYCAQEADNVDQMNSCATCLGTDKINTWGCQNCLQNSGSDTTKASMCHACVQSGLDAYSCGQCALMSGAAATTCFNCLKTAGSDTWPCISGAPTPTQSPAWSPMVYPPPVNTNSPSPVKPVPTPAPTANPTPSPTATPTSSPPPSPVKPVPSPITASCNISDWRCESCVKAATANPPAASLHGQCYNCSLEAGSQASACSECMASSNNTAIVTACLGCVAKGLPGWACTNQCAAYSTNTAQFAACQDCLSTPNVNTWGCQNCLQIAGSDVTKYTMCMSCVKAGGDSTSCGVCAGKADAAACYRCYQSNPRNFWDKCNV